ncbi:5-hydroxytryptamine receptor 3A-like [Patella vulgata]|uniref:5-hydroxytryptamine receptor 3A-like n=1 Tax=Patella vulgata TaxID=6465 RepID=UPI0024A8DBFE|nr:5-hydroxytryptamine receptor 3A-like [Patella vulgata]
MNEIQQILKLFCSFQLSWTDDFLRWDPNSFGGLSKIQIDSHLVYGEWNFDVISFAVSNLKFDNTDYDVSSFNISIRFTRNPLFFAVSALFPVVLLSFLNVFAFCLPDNSGEKTSFSITLLLALAVFLTSIESSLPKSSTNVNYITLYITSLLVISCLIVMTNIFLLYFHHKLQRKEEWERNHDTAQDTTDNTLTHRILQKLKLV